MSTRYTCSKVVSIVQSMYYYYSIYMYIYTYQKAHRAYWIYSWHVLVNTSRTVNSSHATNRFRFASRKLSLDGKQSRSTYVHCPCLWLNPTPSPHPLSSSALYTFWSKIFTYTTHCLWFCQHNHETHTIKRLSLSLSLPDYKYFESRKYINSIRISIPTSHKTASIAKALWQRTLHSLALSCEGVKDEVNSAPTSSECVGIIIGIVGACFGILITGLGMIL